MSLEVTIVPHCNLILASCYLSMDHYEKADPDLLLTEGKESVNCPCISAELIKKEQIHFRGIFIGKSV